MLSSVKKSNAKDFSFLVPRPIGLVSLCPAELRAALLGDFIGVFTGSVTNTFGEIVKAAAFDIGPL